MNDDLKNLGNLDRLIHEPARLMIMSILSGVEEADFLYLQRESGLTKGNLSSHLTKLEKGAYLMITKTYRGKLPLTLCSLTEKGRQAFKNYYKQMRQFMNNLPENRDE